MTQLLEKEDFLSVDRCDYIIEKFGGDLAPLAVLDSKRESRDGVVDERFRIATGKFLMDRDDGILSWIRRKIAVMTGLPEENQEAPHLIRYDLGGKYEAHYDFFLPNDKSFTEDCVLRGGQRAFTVIIYLNDDFEGGGTDLPRLNYMVEPRKGKVVAWKNLHEDGSPNVETLHAGLPVISGTKWILVTWVRQHKFF